MNRDRRIDGAIRQIVLAGKQPTVDRISMLLPSVAQNPIERRLRACGISPRVQDIARDAESTRLILAFSKDVHHLFERVEDPASQAAVFDRLAAAIVLAEGAADDETGGSLTEESNAFESKSQLATSSSSEDRLIARWEAFHANKGLGARLASDDSDQNRLRPQADTHEGSDSRPEVDRTNEGGNAHFDREELVRLVELLDKHLPAIEELEPGFTTLLKKPNKLRNRIRRVFGSRRPDEVPLL